MRRLPVIFIVKVTHLCNMACSYCYDADKHSESQVMDAESLEELIHWSYIYCKNEGITTAEFVWHGGEPTLAGVEFYRSVVELQQEVFSEISYKNGIQTNGTLLSDEFVDFIIEYDFKVSVSLDGPKTANSPWRVRKDGCDPFEEVEKTITVMKEKGISVGIGAVVHRGNYDKLIDTYNYFKKHDLNYNIVFDFNEELETDYLMSVKESVLDLFRHWCKDENTLKVRLLNSMLMSFIHQCNSECTFNISCCSGEELLVVNTNGDIYPCSIFVDDSRYLFGNIGSVSSYSDIQASIGYHTITKNKKENAQRCNQCTYYNLCYGGCMARYQKDISRDYSCSFEYDSIIR